MNEMNLLPIKQQGGNLKKYLTSTVKQDNTASVVNKPKTQILIDPLTRKPAVGDRAKLLVASNNPRYQGEIKTPDNKSVREKIIKGLDYLDREGQNMIVGTATQPVKSALKLLRPDKYFENVHGDASLGDALLNMGMDGLAVYGTVKGVKNFKSPSTTAPKTNTPVPSQDKIYHMLDDYSDEAMALDEQYGLAKDPTFLNKVKEEFKGVLDKKFIPVGKKQILPDDLSLEVEHLKHGGSNKPMITINAKDKQGKAWGMIGLQEAEDNFIIANGKRYQLGKMTPEEAAEVFKKGADGKRIYNVQRETGLSKEWVKPNFISVNPELRGRKFQDVLYQKGIEEAKKMGFKGIKSGEGLLSPEATMKAQLRFDREIFDVRTTNGVEHDVAGLLGHKNPEVINDWFKQYDALNKFEHTKLSINDVLKKSKEVLHTKPFKFAK